MLRRYKLFPLEFHSLIAKCLYKKCLVGKIVALSLVYLYMAEEVLYMLLGAKISG